MGIFDSIAAQVGEALPDNASTGVLQLVQQIVGGDQGSGGLAGLVEKFNAADLGSVVSSWISQGDNLPVSASQISSAFGSSQIQNWAQQLGISTDAISQQLSQWLPKIVDQLTPNGQLPADNGAASPVTSMLQGFLKG